jgi:hypothetical protein
MIFEISRNGYTNGFLRIFYNKIYYDWVNFDVSSYNEEPQSYIKNCNKDIFNKWYHVTCYFDISKDYTFKKLKFINRENDITSPGIMLIRQFKLWKDITKLRTNNKLSYIALTRNVNRNNVFLSIDSLINPDKIFYTYSPGYTVTCTKNPSEVNYDYTPIETEIPELELCDETEEFSQIVNLQAIDDLTFEDIIPSGTGRYTIEFWTKIKSLKYFLTGMNIVWKGHISISILTDASIDKLSVYCFPQDYLTSPLNYQGTKIINQAI